MASRYLSFHLRPPDCHGHRVPPASSEHHQAVFVPWAGHFSLHLETFFGGRTLVHAFYAVAQHQISRQMNQEPFTPLPSFPGDLVQPLYIQKTEAQRDGRSWPAAVMKCHRQVAFETQKGIAPSSGGWKSEARVSA